MRGYNERWYRFLHDKSLSACEVAYRESDVLFLSDPPLDRKAIGAGIKKYYELIQSYVDQNPQFTTSLSPLNQDSIAPQIIQDMITGSSLSGIGPFSCVAGAICDYLGRELMSFCEELILENGGDLFLSIKNDKTLGVYLGEYARPSSLKVRIKKRPKPFGICSSSGKIGHSFSLGRADVVTVIARDAILADTFATAFCNKLKKKEDIKKIIKEGQKYPFIEGLILACDGTLGVWGDVELVE